MFTSAFPWGRVHLASLRGLAFVAASLALAPAAAAELHGAGATFPAPLYKAWIERFVKQHPGASIRYEPVGSGEGVARFIAGAVDFAGTDVAVPTTSDERSGAVGAQFPVTAGMVALAYNLPGVAGQLRLPRSVYLDIFLRNIRRWNDPRIIAANPQARLPDRDIVLVAREDSSGTTFAFTTHAAAVSPAWNKSGVGKKVAWPASVTLAPGNEGVAARIKSSEGAIGYLEYGFARRLGLKAAALENSDGKFVAPSAEAGAAAINQSSYLGLDNLKASVLDPTGAGAYPIVSYSWLILRWDYPPEQLQLVNDFVSLILGEGQKTALEMGYVPLPEPVAYRGRLVLARIFPNPGADNAMATAGEGPAPIKAVAAAAPPAPAIRADRKPSRANARQ